jgi:soluble lytic murein transglycosylase
MTFIKRHRLFPFILFILFSLSTSQAQTPRERHDKLRAEVERGDHSAAMSDLQALRLGAPAIFTLNNYDYLLARLAERRGDATLAAANYQAVVARNSILTQYALWHLAQFARSTGDLTLERVHLRQLLAFGQTSLLQDAASARLGQSFYESKDYASVISTLRPQASPKTSAASRAALTLVAQSLLASGQKDAAREAFTNLVTRLPDVARPDDYALTGARALDALDNPNADGSPNAAPQLPESEHLRRAFIYNFNRDFAGARLHYQSIIERYPQSSFVADALFQIGRGYAQERHYEEALPHLQRAATQYASTSSGRDALSLLASSYARLKRTDEAVASYRLLIERNAVVADASNTERPYLNLIDTLREVGRDQEALAVVAETREKFKDQIGATLALFTQARIHLAQNAWPQALNDLDALRAADDLGGARVNGGTNSNEITFLRALTLENLGRMNEAVDAYLSLPDGRNEYYGGRATERLRSLAVESNAQKFIKERLEALRQDARQALNANQPELARRAAQNALRLSTDSTNNNELLATIRRAYAALPAYNKVSAAKLLSIGRSEMRTGEAGAAATNSTHRNLSDELLFLGLADEGAPELAAARNEMPSSSTSSALKPQGTLSISMPVSSDAAYTLAVLFNRGDHADQAIRYAEPVWKNVPADYLLELAPREMLELLYPAPYRDALLEYAPPRNVDPRFILSIARQESRFRPEVKSVAAARGLLQFISSTANETATQLGKKDFPQDDLYNPRIAILFGSQYMGNLFKMFPAMPQAVAASYNSGEDNVARWVARARSQDPDRYVAEVGLAQTKDYVYKVLANFRTYQMLYSKELQTTK